MTPETMNELLEIMEKEGKTIEALLEIELGKNDILVSKDLASLADLTEKENDFSQFLSEMEDRRVNLLRKNDLPGKLTDIESEVPAEYREKVRLLQDQVAERLKKLKLMNEMNSRILLESIRFFKYTIDLLSGENDSRNIYSLDGQEQTTSGKKAIVLDRKI